MGVAHSGWSPKPEEKEEAEETKASEEGGEG
jgi:hypothetical protein